MEDKEAVEGVTSQNKPQILKRVAVGIAGLNTFLLLTALIMSIVVTGRLTFDFGQVLAIVYTLMAILIISRQPGHIVGWLFLTVGFFSALSTFLGGFEPLADNQILEPIIPLLYWISNWVWMPIFFIPLTLVLQFFPDGRLPSPRWWPVTAATLIGILGISAALQFSPWPAEEFDVPFTDNPFALPGSQDFFAVINQISTGFLVLGFLGSMLAVIVRYRRSSGIERFQMKWLVFTAVVAISLLLGLEPLVNLFNDLGFNPGFLSDPGQITDFVFEYFPIFLAIVIGIAILRYQLFDIDIIIRRTLQYTIVTGILGLVYFGLVISLQSLFAAVEFQGGESPIFIVISTLVIAGLFNPLRKRVQNSVDRRFYRRKYHAEQALARFSAAARDEVDLDRLSEALLEVVQETMQPESVGLTMLSGKKLGLSGSPLG